MSTERATVLVDGSAVEVTHPEKLYWPEDGLKKADLLRYFTETSEAILPHLAGRPLALTRYPEGIHGGHFYQKALPPHAPQWIKRVSVQHEEKTVEYVVADRPATLIWLANQGVIEAHPWMSRIGALDRPDVAVIDLDPAEGASFAQVRKVCGMVRTLLDSWGLAGYPKLSGATGVHIYIPLEPAYSYDITSRLVGLAGRLLQRAWPEGVTTERRVARRKGKVYVDHLQNARGKTVVAPYFPRPLPGAPVAAPLSWKRLLEDESVHPGMFSIRVPQEAAASHPPFQRMYERRQSIDHLLHLL